MDNQTQQKPITAETAEAEGRNAATELGKFKSVEALMQAYADLEAEFTRRSQRLKELENANKGSAPPADNAENGEASSQGQEVLSGDGLVKAAMQSEEVKTAIIGEYLKNAAANKGVPVITGGVNVAARKKAPASVREAGRLAETFLNKGGN